VKAALPTVFYALGKEISRATGNVTSPAVWYIFLAEAHRQFNIESGSSGILAAGHRE